MPVFGCVEPVSRHPLGLGRCLGPLIEVRAHVLRLWERGDLREGEVEGGRKQHLRSDRYLFLEEDDPVLLPFTRKLDQLVGRPGNRLAPYRPRPAQRFSAMPRRVMALTVAAVALRVPAPAFLGAPATAAERRLVDPAGREEYGKNLAQYLVDLHDAKAAFDFCGGVSAPFRATSWCGAKVFWVMPLQKLNPLCGLIP